MKVLNLYSGLGGNRKLWEDVEVTSVELDPEIARIYKKYFPGDNCHCRRCTRISINPFRGI